MKHEISAIRFGLRPKLILFYALVALLSFIAVAIFIGESLEDRSRKQIEASLIAEARLVAIHIQPEKLKNQDEEYLGSFARAIAPVARCRVTIISPQGKVLADSGRSHSDMIHMDNHLGRTEVRAALSRGVGVDIHRSPTLRADMLYVAIKLQQDGGAPLGILRLSVPLEDVRKTLDAIRNIIILGFFFALALAVALGSIFASHTIGPIRRMIYASRRFADGDFTHRIIPSSKDELGELATTLNTMAQHLEDKIRELGTQNQKLSAVFNSMTEGIIITDRLTKVLSINTSAERIFALQADRSGGRLFLETIRNADIAAVIENVLATGRPVSEEAVIVYPLKKVLQVNAAPIFRGADVTGCLIVMHDITEMRRLETVRRDFVANVSHELKTPLTSIKGFVETLLDGAIDDRENNRRFLEIIRNHTDRVTDLIDDLLSLSCLESKEISLEREDLNLRAQTDEVIEGFATQLKKRGIVITNDLPADLSLRADRHRIVQVLTNLIDNAIKFNKESGSIRISGRRADDGVEVSVEDSGVGIPPKDVPRIFERFYRVDKARSREMGGTGLGLSIVKHIVELHGGTVGVKSTEGHGSTFWFTLPV